MSDQEIAPPAAANDERDTDRTTVTCDQCGRNVEAFVAHPDREERLCLSCHNERAAAGESSA
jgi:formylmethanofuran dehydrogenase subunit E